MPKYTTVVLTNLQTGSPFTFEVSKQMLDYMEHQLKLIKSDKAPRLGKMDNLTRSYEFSMFPSYKKLLSISLKNEFSNELLTEILQEFGVTDKKFIQKLLEDEEYISQIRPWFEGICNDGERAARTLSVIYGHTQSFYTVKV